MNILSKNKGVIEAFCKKYNRPVQDAEYLVLTRSGNEAETLDWHRKHPDYLKGRYGKR